MADIDTKFTEKELGDAYVFLSDLQDNKILKNQWQNILSRTKSTTIAIKAKVDYINNFLSEQGYETTAPAVLHVIKSDWWAKYLKDSTSNTASDQFVRQIIKEPSLYVRWSKILTKCLKDGSMKEADDLLKTLGYQCTAQQVNASFRKMRSQNIRFWTGVYGKSYQKLIVSADGSKVDKDKQKPTPLPLIIYGDGTISIGPDHIFGSTYKNGVISWPLQPKDSEKYPFPNPHSGSIVLSQITSPKKQNGYVGPIFSGEIEYPDEKIAHKSDVYAYEGQLGEPDPVTPGSHKFHIPADMHNKKKMSALQIVSAVAGVGGGMIFIVMAVFGVSKWGVDFIRQRFNKPTEEGGKTPEEVVEDNMTKNEDLIQSPDYDSDCMDTEAEKTLDQLQDDMKGTGDPAERQKIQDEIDQQKEQITEENAEAEKQEADEKSDMESDSDMADDLGDFVE